jgi:hypothetical protein
MPTDHRAELQTIRTFPSLVKYLRDEMNWPITTGDFEELTFEYTPEELGIDPKNAAKIEEIKRLRPLSTRQPWGIFFVKFEPKRLPIVALRRILGQLALKKRASANNAERTAWAQDDLLFVSNYGEGDERQISFAHFSRPEAKNELPTLKVLGWDSLDTALHLDAVADRLTHDLAWPDDDSDVESWRATWRSAFTLRHREVVTTSRELSSRLAQLARSIRSRIGIALAIETDDGPLTSLLRAFQEALVHDLDKDGFADMYAQTIAYGLLSARVANPTRPTASDASLQPPVTSPFLKELMETFLHVGGQRGSAGGAIVDFDELGVSEVVELLDDANMEAVIRDFGDKNPEDDPVIHFYELFLKEYDAKERMQRGVFYTPRPVVSFIVRSVHELLKRDFDLADGLADTTTWGAIADRNADLKIPAGVDRREAFVQILDPATGTGTFLVEVIDLIHRHMVAKWTSEGNRPETIDALWNDYVPTHLLPRLHGYELLMAPYAIAHVKIGLKLYETGYRFEQEKRVRVYLTNTLEPAQDLSGQLEFEAAALAHEAQAVNDVKRHQCFTVVIGNPPYANFGQLNRNPFILELLEDYKRDLGEKKLNLDDDFIKFIRWGEYVLHEATRGVLGMITNNTFLDGPTRRGMRKHLLETFDVLHILDLHGNSIEREVCPDGTPDDNVFDIQQGVAISLFIRLDEGAKEVALANLQGSRRSKYDWLSRESDETTEFERVDVEPELFLFALRHAGLGAEFSRFVPLPDVLGLRGSGVKTDRDKLCFDMDRSQLARRMRTAFVGQWTSDFVAEYSVFDSSSYALTSRLRAGAFDEECIQSCLYRLFDERWLYYQPGFTSRPAWDVMQHLLKPNLGLIAKRQARDGEYNWFFVCRGLLVDGLFSIDNKGREQVFPLYIYESGVLNGRVPNLSRQFCHDLAGRLRVSVTKGLPEGVTPEEIFHFIYAVSHSPTYRERYAPYLRTEFPRVPLPANAGLFNALARLGDQLVGLHLMQAHEDSRFATTYIGSHTQEVKRVGWSDETVWVDADVSRGHAARPGTAGFQGVTEAVWNLHIGGHQVCEKWLKDRKGRVLSEDDIVHYQRIVAALSETIRLMHDIDDVVEEHGGWPGAFLETRS